MSWTTRPFKPRTNFRYSSKTKNFITFKEFTEEEEFKKKKEHEEIKENALKKAMAMFGEIKK